MPPLTWHWCCDCDVISPDTNAPLMSWLLPVTAWSVCSVFCQLGPSLVTEMSRDLLQVSGVISVSPGWDISDNGWLIGTQMGQAGDKLYRRKTWVTGHVSMSGPGSVRQTPGPGAGVRCSEQILRGEETTWPPAHPGTSTQLWPGHRGGNIGSEERGVQWQQRGLRTQWSQWRD